MGKNKVFVLGIGISNLSFNQVLEEIEKYLKTSNKIYQIFTPNPEILVFAQKDKKFAKILNNADLALPDGQGIVWASRFLGQPLPERVSGTDLLEKLAELASKKGLTIGLIGGGPRIAVKAAECLKKRYPGLKTVVFEDVMVDKWGKELPGEKILRYYDITSQKEKILKNNSLNILISQYPHIDFLFVGLGAPKQEYFIDKLKTQMSKVKTPLVMIGVGGAFDYLAGRIPRAPKWVRKLGFEWLYRLIREPWRLWRQLALLKFIIFVLRSKSSAYSNRSS